MSPISGLYRPASVLRRACEAGSVLPAYLTASVHSGRTGRPDDWRTRRCDRGRRPGSLPPCTHTFTCNWPGRSSPSVFATQTHSTVSGRRVSPHRPTGPRSPTRALGSGAGLIVVGGMLRASRDYLNPGRELDEPSVVLDGSPAPAWLDPCRELLTRGDSRGAFATTVKHAGFAPGELAALPLKQRPGARRICRLGHRHAAIRPDRLVRQEAALDALFTAPTIQGRDGHVPRAIRLDRTLEFLERWHVPVRARVSVD